MEAVRRRWTAHVRPPRGIRLRESGGAAPPAERSRLAGQRYPGPLPALLQELGMLLPAGSLILVFLVWPFVLSFWLALTNERLIPRPVPARYVGLANFQGVLTAPEFWNALWNVTSFMILLVPLQCGFALAMALLINTKLPFRNLFRSLLFLPAITSMVVVSAIWATLFQFPTGPLNQLARVLSFGTADARQERGRKVSGSLAEAQAGPQSPHAAAAIRLVSVAVIALVVVSPLAIPVVASLKANRFIVAADMGSLRAFWVEDPTLANYQGLLTLEGTPPFGRYLLNSIVILAATVLGGLIVNSMAAFVLAWGRLPGRAAVLTAVIALYIIPHESIVMPLLLMINRAGLTDGFLAQILPWMASPFFIFLFYQFFIQVPRELVEAAVVDGASMFRIYASIFMPISLPVIATVAILHGVEMWNQYLWPLMVTKSNYARPITIGIASFFGDVDVYWENVMTGSVIMMVPVLVLYVLFQRWFIGSFIGSAVKG